MDIVDRLKRDPGSYVCIKREAAQEIEALRKQIAAMKDEQRMALTSPSTARRWLSTLARHYPSLLVSGVCHSALGELDAITAELEQVHGDWSDEIDRHNRTIDEAAALTAERDRLREALERIVAEQRVGRVDEIARAALKETSK